MKEVPEAPLEELVRGSKEIMPSGKELDDLVESKGVAWLNKVLLRVFMVACTLAVTGLAVAVGTSRDLQEDVLDAGRALGLVRDGPPAAAPASAAAEIARGAEVRFTVHWNGDGASTGIATSSRDWLELDALIRSLCEELPEVGELAQWDNDTVAELCEPTLGAKLFTHGGRRVRSWADVGANGTRTYVVPRGLLFVFPLGKVGSVIEPTGLASPIPDKPVRLRQLSNAPRVFSLENFITPEEVQAILDHNADLVKPSEVGFAGWRDSTRTSSTAWDFHSWAARKVRRRSFDLLGMDFDGEMADALQVLRYEENEWYKPHMDAFDGKAYDGHDPTVNNGTNRFATVFLYLTDVEEGGHTVFPLSTTHEGYNGEKIVHDGTINTPGYIAQRDAERACNTSSTALRSSTVRGGAVLFYSQGPDGALDPYSLHGGCPVVSGIKWSANVWLWNRPKPSKDSAKDAKQPAPNNDSIQLMFHNKRNAKVDLMWDDGTEAMVFQGTIEPGAMQPMTTYHGHRFVARDSASQKQVHAFVARDSKHKGTEHVEDIPQGDAHGDDDL